MKRVTKEQEPSKWEYITSFNDSFFTIQTSISYPQIVNFG